MLKRTIVRLLLFGIPFGLSYWASRPVPQVVAGQAVVVCAYPGDRPGELRISLQSQGCASAETGNETRPASLLPAMRAVTEGVDLQYAPESVKIPF